MKTVSELAKELNINRTTLHRLIQRNNIETLQEGNKRLIDTRAEQAILRAFSRKMLQGETLQSNNKSLQQCNVAQTEQLASKDKIIDSLQAQLTDKENQISLLQSQLDSLKVQLTDRDKTVERLEQDKAKLNDRLDKAETNISNLTTALTAAQALHGMDKQQAVIEVNEQPVENQEMTQPEPEQKKRCIFSRIFKR